VSDMPEIAEDAEDRANPYARSIATSGIEL
jgi:hypothetical protein